MMTKEIKDIVSKDFELLEIRIGKVIGVEEELLALKKPIN